MKKLLPLLVALSAYVAISVGQLAFAVGLWPGLPIEGGASYCGGWSGLNAGNTTPGTFTTSQCETTVPAGQATPTGQEYAPVDLWGMSQTTNSQGQPATNGVAASAFGFGPITVVTTGTSVTVPNNTPNYVYNDANIGAVTITLPAAPQPWQIQRIAVPAGTGSGGSLVVAANSGQSCVPSSNCGLDLGSAASAAYAAYLYDPANTTWYRVQ
jgi:hypothetical protein